MKKFIPSLATFLGLQMSAFFALMPLRVSAGEIVVVHFGDSTTITSFLPKDKRVDAKLQKLLQDNYKNQKVRCVNAGEGGDYIRRFLDEGRYQKIKKQNPHIDIAFIRYGQNDMKHYKPEEFKEHLKEFIGVLRKDYPGIHIFLETGIYIDGKHWYDQRKNFSDANKKYQRYWEITRQVAKEMNIPLVDQWERWRVETAKGLWDLRIRNSAHADDPNHPQHFYNAHPNETGVILYALEQYRHLKFYFPDKLPKAGDEQVDPKKMKVPPPKATGAKYPPEEGKKKHAH